MIAMWWDDLDPAEGGHIYYYYDAANERFIVTFDAIQNYITGGGTGSLTFQALLYPDGRVVIQYSSMNPGSDPDGLEGATVGIENESGTDGLEVVFNGAYMHNSLTVEFYMPYQWLTLSQYSGSIPPGEADTIECQFTTAELDTGTYNADVVINSNDPDPGDSSITIGAELTVVQSMYLCGDANGDGDVNVGDGVLIINYVFKSGPPPDPLCIGDLNGDDDVNVADAVYLINYIFKSGPPPVEPCCP